MGKVESSMICYVHYLYYIIYGSCSYKSLGSLSDRIYRIYLLIHMQFIPWIAFGSQIIMYEANLHQVQL